MENNWDLNTMYIDYKSDKFKKDISDFSKAIDSFNNWCSKNLNSKDNAFKKIETYIQKLNDLDKFYAISSYISLKLSTDTTNNELLNISSKLDNIIIELNKANVIFNLFIKDINNLDDIIKDSRILSNYSFILKEQKENSRYLLDKNTETYISKMTLNGSNMWNKQWKQLTSTLEIPFYDKILTLPEIRNLAYNNDSSIRKKAYENELLAYEKISLPASFCLNGIKGEVLEICSIKGYDSPLDMSLKSSRLDRKIFDVMMECIKDNLPKLQKYFIKKASILGHKNTLPFYDLFAPIKKDNITFSYDEATKYIYNNFSKFSAKMGDFAKKAFDNKWIDVYPRKGKVGGAFCQGIKSIGESRILLNFSGTFDSVLTMAHELGHAYHNLCLQNESPINSDYSMPIAETASTLCESIIINSALENATKDEKAIILENDLSGVLQCIVDIYSRFLFEDTIFKKRKEGFVSQDEICSIMEEAQKKAYGNSLDENYLHKYMWICKTHYYYADSNYYNFPYAYGTLFSKGLFALYLKDKNNFIKDYDNMLSITGKNDLYNVGKFIGIDLTSRKFWQDSIDLIIKDIDKYCKL